MTCVSQCVFLAFSSQCTCMILFFSVIHTIGGVTNLINFDAVLSFFLFCTCGITNFGSQAYLVVIYSQNYCHMSYLYCNLYLCLWKTCPWISNISFCSLIICDYVIQFNQKLISSLVNLHTYDP